MPLFTKGSTEIDILSFKTEGANVKQLCGLQDDIKLLLTKHHNWNEDPSNLLWQYFNLENCHNFHDEL